MLKINKILSKKIKFPLSLRGLFPFCHSRESGNLSSLLLRGAKRRSNLKGFSLIELMIAITILAMAIFGIFHAYSVGFLGMADARDRTVATNYAREAMEDVKNMDFEKIETTTRSVTNFNTKYRVDVNVSLENPNLKKVYTVVSWKNRNEIIKTVETSMLVNYTEIYASKAAKIVLYADSYSILNTSSMGGATFANLTAVIKDIKGNTIIDWGTRTGEGDITFTITDRPELGYLNEIIGAPSGTTTVSIKPTEGRASTFFTSSGSDLGITEVGYSEITASVNLPIIGNASDLVTIKITDGPVKIILSEPIPDIIKASTSNYSTITVSLRNSANVILDKSDLVTDVEITFIVFGEGKLSSPTITIPKSAIGGELAIATIDLYSTGNPGLASLLATADDLESDTVDVRFLGPPVSISISANPNPIYVDDIEGSTVTVSLLDVNGFSTNPTEVTLSISLTLETSVGVGGDLEGGDLEDDSFSFLPSESEGIIKTTTFYGQLSEGTAIITASDGGSMGNSVTISIKLALVPDHIELSANPENAKAGPGVGEEYISTIKAIVYDSSGKIVTNYNEKIYFETTMGIFSNDKNFIEPQPDNGFATAQLSSSSSGFATVTVSSGTLNDVTVLVGFYTDPGYIGLAFNPPEKEVKADGVETITIVATIYDVDYIIITGHNEIISFNSINIGTFSNGFSFIELTPVNGVATAKLSSSTPGETTVIVSSGSLNVSEVLKFYEETTLTLVENETSPKYSSTDKEVTFDVDVAGYMITVDEMKVIWDNSSPSERLYKIVIDDDEIYNGSDKSGTIVDIEPNEVLLTGRHTIKLTFIQDMAERHIDVMFYPPGEGWHLIRFEVPVV